MNYGNIKSYDIADGTGVRVKPVRIWLQAPL